MRLLIDTDPGIDDALALVMALTSPEDTIIVGFNVVPDDRARALAEFSPEARLPEWLDLYRHWRTSS